MENSIVPIKTGIHDVLDKPPFVNGLYAQLSLRDILNTTQTCRAFNSAFEASDIFLAYCNTSPPQELTRRGWTLLHIKVGVVCRQEWLMYWDEAQLEICQYRLSHFWVSPELSQGLRYGRAAAHSIPSGVCMYAGMKIGFWAGTKAGAVAGTVVVPGLGTVSGAAVGGVVGAGTGALAGFAIGGALGKYCFDRYVLSTDEYRNFKIRAGKQELNNIVSLFFSSSDPISDYYRCGVSGNIAGPDREFAEGATGVVYDVNALRVRIPDLNALHPISTELVEWVANPPDATGPYAIDLTGGTQTPQELFGVLNDLNGSIAPARHRFVCFNIRLSDLDIDINSESFCLQDAQQLTVIRSYRAAYAVLCRKLYLLKTGILEDQIQSTELKSARKELSFDWSNQSLQIRSLAKDQIDAFLSLYEGCKSRQLRSEMKKKLHAELDLAAKGTREVMFTPLLDLGTRFSRSQH